MANIVQSSVTFALALLPLQLNALPPEPPPEIELYISGSTAQDELLENLMRLKSGIPGTPNICQDGSLDIYRGQINGIRKRMFYCLTTDSIPGVEAGRRLAVHKSSGGSGEGVTPVAGGEPVTFIDLDDLPQVESCRAPARVLHTGDLSAYSNRRACDGGGKRAVPIAGISDIEPELVGEVSAPLTSRSQAQLVWGLPVSKNFRNALQAVQGLVPASVPHDHPSRETMSSMPTLSRLQVASIYAGTLSSWEQLYDATGKPLHRSSRLAAAGPDNPDLAGTAPGAYRPDPDTGHAIYVCRRIAGSGTQASYEIHYLRQRCLADAPTFVAPDDGSDLARGGDVEKLVRRAQPAGRVFAGVGTSDVRACLDAHDEFNRWAIGIFSTENIGNNASREFRHIKVDGYAPTLLNAHHGRWVHVSEPSIQWPSSYDDVLERTDEGRVLRFIARNIGLPGVVRSLNTSFVHSWGAGGYLALPGKGVQPLEPPVTEDTLQEDPVASLTKSVDGRPRNCNIPLIKTSSSAVR